MADKKPWFKFYPSDWRAEKTLRICGAAARGLWIEMLCLMHEATPYGHLLVNGNPLTDVQLANLSGIPQDQIPTLLTELENAGVFSKSGKGTIYSRRMTRDARKAAKCSKAGKDGGGNPSLQTEKSATFKGDAKGQNDTTFALEARDQIPDIPKKDSLENVGRSLSFDRPQKPWSREQKKAAWQGKICNEAQRTMPAGQYAQFLVAWAEGEPQAVKLAEQIDRRLKAEAAKKGRAA